MFESTSMKRSPIYMSRCAALRRFIEIDAPPELVMRSARLLLTTGSSPWRAVAAWAWFLVTERVQQWLLEARVTRYALWHRCSRERALDALYEMEEQ